MLIRPQAAPLRFIATRLAIPEVEKIAREPGVTEVFRVTIQYHDARHPDQVATLVKRQSSPNSTLTVHYRLQDDKPLVLTHTITPDRFTTLITSLRKIKFDSLDDYDDIRWYGADLWLLERGASVFHHDVILAPEQATGVHLELMQLVQGQLREAIRAIGS